MAAIALTMGKHMTNTKLNIVVGVALLHSLINLEPSTATVLPLNIYTHIEAANGVMPLSLKTTNELLGLTSKGDLTSLNSVSGIFLPSIITMSPLHDLHGDVCGLQT